MTLNPSWQPALQSEFAQPYFQIIQTFLKKERASGTVVCPPEELIFSAFDRTAFNDVKVVILGQDPYHNIGQAMGLSFSVPRGVAVPPSLQNVYKELQSDLGIAPPATGDLSAWAAQGVFLLNATLTVAAHKANSHSKIGWETFTNKVIKCLSDDREHLVFILWGKFAQAKSAFIDTEKHLVLMAAHPSPLAGNAFQGCKHFSLANDYLLAHGKEKINWNV